MLEGMSFRFDGLIEFLKEMKFECFECAGKEKEIIERGYIDVKNFHNGFEFRLFFDCLSRSNSDDNNSFVKITKSERLDEGYDYVLKGLCAHKDIEIEPYSYPDRPPTLFGKEVTEKTPSLLLEANEYLRNFEDLIGKNQDLAKQLKEESLTRKKLEKELSDTKEWNEVLKSRNKIMDEDLKKVGKDKEDAIWMGRIEGMIAVLIMLGIFYFIKK